MEDQEKVRRALIGLLVALAISISMWVLGFAILAMITGSSFGAARDGTFPAFMTGHRILLASMVVATIGVMVEGYRVGSRWLDARRKRDATDQLSEHPIDSDREQSVRDEAALRTEDEAPSRHRDFHSTL